MSCSYRKVDEQKLIDEETYPAEDLLTLFLSKIIALPQKLGNYSGFDKLVITVERLTKENMEISKDMSLLMK